MAVFKDCTVLLELKPLPFKEKKKLNSAITQNGGTICYLVNKQCSFIVATDVSNLSSNRLRSIQKYQTPVVGLNYVNCCLKTGALLPLDDFKLDTSSSKSPSSTQLPIPNKVFGNNKQIEKHNSNKVPKNTTEHMVLAPVEDAALRPEVILKKYRHYSESHSALPSYPNHFQVAKFGIYKKRIDDVWCVLELQSCRGDTEQLYRLVQYRKDKHSAKGVMDDLVFPPSAREAIDVFKAMGDHLLANGHIPMSFELVDAPGLGSFPLKQLLLDKKLSTMKLSEEVAMFVELVWAESLGYLDDILQVPIDKISLNDVTRAEGLLLQAQKMQQNKNLTQCMEFLSEFNALLPQTRMCSLKIKNISQRLDLCQLIRDILNVTEMTLGSPTPSSLGKYRALRCCIEVVSPESPEFHNVMSLLGDSSLQIQQVLRVSRVLELQAFRSDLGNVRQLLHSTSPSNFVGILSRGLLLPHTGVELHGIERTDVGNLGSGIYFSDAVSTSLKYSKPSSTDGSRLLLVCDVALGRCKKVHQRDVTLTKAPEGHDSVQGVRRSGHSDSDFEDDEFVVYSPDQVKLKYVIQFSIKDDQLKEFSPTVITTEDPNLSVLTDIPTDVSFSIDEEISKNTTADVTPGLLNSGGQQLPLQAVHVKCKLMDLVSQVIIFQKYTNTSALPIEAKYVFPLDDLAAVCGFEAFINGKHVVGQVKEKQQARKEYREAVEKGHGAYLMDQDAANVFTISVGNLPPNSTVLIKVTYVSELIIKDGGILFSLPASVAPWQESEALNLTTQFSVKKVTVDGEAASSREFSLDMSVEMPNKIIRLESTTHQIKTKLTDCKAVLSVLPGQVIGTEGFQLFVSLSVVHLPRMWVEQHPDKESQACMLVFYPEFETSFSSEDNEIVLLLDNSKSMRGEPNNVARIIKNMVLRTLGKDCKVRINIIIFGSDYIERFEMAQPLNKVYQIVEEPFEMPCIIGGSTELWRPLRALGLLPPSCGIRNVLLLSDGHIQNPELTLQLVRDNVHHSRLFTCGIGPTANQHMLRALAQAGGGAYEFFDTKMKHKWADKVAFQLTRMASPGCTSVSVKWQQFNTTAPPPVQAPKQLHALFNNCHTLVYGFVPNCTQATLQGNLSGQELKTMVSTTELQKTKGTFLHKLTARALIRDYEDGSLDTNEAEHEGKKAELKSFVIQLSEEFSVLSQFTSFVAIEERDSEQQECFTDFSKLVAEEDVDLLPYMSWDSPEAQEEVEEMDFITDNEEENFYGFECVEEEFETYDDLTPWHVDDSVEESYSERSKSPQDSYSRRAELASIPCVIPSYNAMDISPVPTRKLSYRCISGSQGDYKLPPRLYARKKRLAEPTPIPCAIPTNKAMDILPEPIPVFSKMLSEHSLPVQGSAGSTSVIHYSMSSTSSTTLETHDMLCPEDSLAVRSLPPPLPPRRGATTTNKAVDILPVPLGDDFHPPPPPLPLKTYKEGDIQRELSDLMACSIELAHHISPFGRYDQEAKRFSESSEQRTDYKMKMGRKRSLCYSSKERIRGIAGVNWSKIFQIQHSEGYWELNAELGRLINVDIDVFANVFLKSKGICSLGVKAHADILRLVATLLVLQLMRNNELDVGKLLRSLFCLDSIQSRPQHWEAVHKAVDWVRWADRQYPSIYNRLEFGLNWESFTRQLLGYEILPICSPLRGLNLRKPQVGVTNA